MRGAVRDHPLHLAGLGIGLIGLTVSLWFVDLSGDHWSVMLFGSLALASAIDLARRLGLEPADDPAAPYNRKDI